MRSEFLEIDGIRTEGDAIIWSVNAAVQRNHVYQNYDRRQEVRAEWMRMIREESRLYSSVVDPISETRDCEIIRIISDRLSVAFESSLNGGRLRYGTSQKAFNLYLKYLWQFNVIATPPHCPVDRIVLDALGINDAWTRCDDQTQYMRWIDAIRKMAGPKSVAQWENETWLRSRKEMKKACLTGEIANTASCASVVGSSK
jgi:hypothetical protein